MPVSPIVTNLYALTGFTADILRNAISAIGSARRTLRLGAGAWIVNSPLTVPSNVHLEFEAGAIITKSDSGTVAISGTIDAPPIQLFSGFSVGDVVFYGGRVARCFPQWFGAVGDGVADDTSALRAAIAAAGAVSVLPGATHLLSGTLVLDTGQAIIGEVARRSFLSAAEGFAGPLVRMTGQQCELRDVDLKAVDSQKHEYLGVLLENCSRADVQRVRAWYPDIGFKLVGYTYWNNLDIDVYQSKTICLQLGEVGGQEVNNNNILFRVLSGRDLTLPTTNPSWCILINAGSVNEIRGGQASYARHMFEVVSGIENRLHSVWNEYTSFGIKAAAGTITCTSSHMAEGVNEIDPNAVVVSDGLIDIMPESSVFGSRLSSDGLKLLYTFDETAGSVVVDHSGNGRHVACSGVPSRSAGIYGPALGLSATGGVGALPVAAADWSSPFTIAILRKRTSAYGQTAALLHLTDGVGFAQVSTFATYSSFRVNNGTDTVTSASVHMPENADCWAWEIFYFDPPNNTISYIDPMKIGDLIDCVGVGPNWSAINAVYIGRNPSAPGLTGGIVGQIAFVGVWQRKLTLKEVLILVNSERAWRPEVSRAGVSVELVAPDASGLVLTAATGGGIQADGVTLSRWRGSAADAPGSPFAGDIYRNTGDSKVYLWDGSAWAALN